MMESPNDPTLYVSACGIFDCSACVHKTRSRCYGCSQGNALIIAHGEKPCEIYRCARSHGITSCKECTESVCPFTRSLEMPCPVRARFEKKRCYARKMSDHFLGRQPDGRDNGLVARRLDKVVERLPWYSFAVQEFLSHGIIRVSSEDIARKVGVKSWVVRRDLSQFGEFGRAGVGYGVSRLAECLADILHLSAERSVAWVGAARIHADKSLIARLRAHRFNVVAIFDSDVSRVPEMIGGVRVTSLADMPRMVAELQVECGIVATSHEEAQRVTDALVAAGVQGILNLTSTLVVTPSNICTRNHDVVAELFALSYHCNESHGRQKETAAPCSVGG